MTNIIKSKFFFLFLLITIFIFFINWIDSRPKLNVVSESGEGLNSISEILLEKAVKNTNYIGKKEVFFKGAFNEYLVEIITENENYYSEVNLTYYLPWKRVYFLINQKNMSYQDSFNIGSGEILDYQVNKIANKLVFFIWIGGEGSGNYGTFYTIEYYDTKFKYYIVDPFDSLNKKLKELYSGHDNYKFKGEEIIRSFPIYKEDDPNCCPTGGRVKIYYRYENQKIFEEKVEINKKDL